MSRRSALALAIVVLVLGAAFFVLFVPVERTTERPPSPRARTNAYLALERSMGRLGVPTRSVRGLAGLPPTDHALVVPLPRRTVTRRAADRLVDWVRRGGHLVVVPARPPDGDPAPMGSDPLLDAIPVRQLARPERDRRVRDVAVQVAGLSGLAPLRVGPEAPSDLAVTGDAEPTLVVGRPHSAVILRVGMGRGQVTVLSDPRILDNDHLDEADHALLAWLAIATPLRPKGVAIVFRDAVPSTWALLAGRAPLAFVSGAVLLVAWFAAASRRFGPLQPPTTPDRRSLGEHVSALGGYLWRHRADAPLLAATREATRRRLVRSGRAAAAELPPGDAGRLARVLAERGLTREQAVLATATIVHGDGRRFVRAVRMLESVRRSQ